MESGHKKSEQMPEQPPPIDEREDIAGAKRLKLEFDRSLQVVRKAMKLLSTR